MIAFHTVFYFDVDRFIFRKIKNWRFHFSKTLQSPRNSWSVCKDYILSLQFKCIDWLIKHCPTATACQFCKISKRRRKNNQRTYLVSLSMLNSRKESQHHTLGIHSTCVSIPRGVNRSERSWLQRCRRCVWITFVLRLP